MFMAKPSWGDVRAAAGYSTGIGSGLRPVSFSYWKVPEHVPERPGKGRALAPFRRGAVVGMAVASPAERKGRGTVWRKAAVERARPWYNDCPGPYHGNPFVARHRERRARLPSRTGPRMRQRKLRGMSERILHALMKFNRDLSGPTRRAARPGLAVIYSEKPQ
jgi:hypothetical protein